MQPSDETVGRYYDAYPLNAKEKNITPVAYGVVGLSKDESASRKVFEFAKTMGIGVINTEAVEALMVLGCDVQAQ